jgi:hypothetical protein
MTGVWVGKGGKNAEVKGLLGPSLIFYPPIVESINFLSYIITTIITIMQTRVCPNLVIVALHFLAKFDLDRM